VCLKKYGVCKYSVSYDIAPPGSALFIECKGMNFFWFIAINKEKFLY